VEHVKFPQALRLLVAEIAAQKVMTVIVLGFFQRLLLEPKAEALRFHSLVFVLFLRLFGSGWQTELCAGQ